MRRLILKAVVGSDEKSRIQFSEEFRGDGAAFFRACADKGLEGIVFKDTLAMSAVDGDEHFVEMPPPVRPRLSLSQLARNDPAELQSLAAHRLIRHIDASLGQHVLDVAVTQGEAEIEPRGLLNDDVRKAVATV